MEALYPEAVEEHLGPHLAATRYLKAEYSVAVKEPGEFLVMLEAFLAVATVVVSLVSLQGHPGAVAVLSATLDPLSEYSEAVHSGSAMLQFPYRR